MAISLYFSVTAECTSSVSASSIFTAISATDCSDIFFTLRLSQDHMMVMLIVILIVIMMAVIVIMAILQVIIIVIIEVRVAVVIEAMLLITSATAAAIFDIPSNKKRFL